MGEATDRMKALTGGALWIAAVKSVRDVGFPIAVAAYLLLGLGPKLDRQTEILTRVLVVLEARR